MLDIDFDSHLKVSAKIWFLSWSLFEEHYVWVKNKAHKANDLKVLWSSASFGILLLDRNKALLFVR